MDFTPEQREFVKPYLTMKVRDGKGWILGVIVGLLICAAALVTGFLRLWAGAGQYLLLALVIGMVLIEISLNRRDKSRLAAIVQKYDAALRDLQQPEGEEETG